MFEFDTLKCFSCLRFCYFKFKFVYIIFNVAMEFNYCEAESQNGVITIQRYSVDNQKGTIAIDFVQQ